MAQSSTDLCVKPKDAWMLWATMMGTVIMDELLGPMFEWVFLLTDQPKVLVFESIPWSKKIKIPSCHLKDIDVWTGYVGSGEMY